MNYCNLIFSDNNVEFICTGSIPNRFNCEFCESSKLKSCTYADYNYCTHKTFSCKNQKAQRECIKRLKQHLEEKFEEFPC